MKSKWFVRNLFKKDEQVKMDHKKSVEQAAISMFAKCDKTFIDLAKYDKGEKIFDTVS